MGGSEKDPDLSHKYYLPAPFETLARFDSNGIQTKEPGVVTNALDENNQESKVAYGMDDTYTTTVLMDEAYTKLAEALAEEYTAADAAAGTPAVTVGAHLDELYAAVDAADEAGKPAAQAALDAFVNDPANGLGYYDKVFEIDDDGKQTANSQIVWVPIERTLTTQKIYTMAEWITAGSPTGNFWIMDNDGWCYWGNVLMPNQATGLLLSEVNIKDNKPSKWTYKINAKLQAVTFDDIAMFADKSEKGGGGITDQGSMVLQAVSGGYAFDWEGSATGATDPVYTFKSYGNNVYAKVTTDATSVTYGNRFIYTGPVPVPTENRGALNAGDSAYQQNSILTKDATGLFATGTAASQFKVVDNTLTQGANGDWYLKLSYDNQSEDVDVYLAVGANRKFDAANAADNDDVLIWVDKDAKPGSGADRKQEAEGVVAKGHKIGDEITLNDTSFQVIGMKAAEGSDPAKTLIISKNVLATEVASADVETKLTEELGKITALSGKTAVKLTVQDALDYFAANADRAATDGTESPTAQTWWLADGTVVADGGAMEKAEAEAKAGIRLAVWVETETLQEAIEAAAASEEP